MLHTYIARWTALYHGLTDLRLMRAPFNFDYCTICPTQLMRLTEGRYPKFTEEGCSGQARRG